MVAQLIQSFLTQTHELRDRRATARHRRHLRFDFLALLFLALDIDVPTQELGREAHILTLFADRERKLRIIDDYLEVLLLRVDDRHVVDLGRAQRVARKGHGILVVLDDVDLFTLQLPDDRLHAHTLHSNTRSHTIYIRILGVDSDLGSLARLAGNRFDHHRAVINLRNFHFEQTLHQHRIRA